MFTPKHVSSISCGGFDGPQYGLLLLGIGMVLDRNQLCRLDRHVGISGKPAGPQSGSPTVLLQFLYVPGVSGAPVWVAPKLKVPLSLRCRNKIVCKQRLPAAHNFENDPVREIPADCVRVAEASSQSFKIVQSI